jgi:PKD repeat protein
MIHNTLKYCYAFVFIALSLFLATCSLERIDPTVKYDPCLKVVSAKFTSNKPSVGVICDSPCVIKFTSLSTVGQSYAWTFGDGGTSTLENPTYSYKNKGSYEVILKVTNVNGCMKEYKETVTVDLSKCK